MISCDQGRLYIAGPVTIDTHLALRNDSADYVTNADIEIDLSGVTELDSSALALIFFWQRCAGEHRITIEQPPSALLALADLYGVTRLLSLKVDTSSMA